MDSRASPFRLIHRRGDAGPQSPWSIILQDTSRVAWQAAKQDRPAPECDVPRRNKAHRELSANLFGVS